MKRNILVISLCILLLLVSGCGLFEEKAEVNKVTICKTGEVKETIVEGFNEADYSASELRQFIEEEIKSSEVKAAVESLEVANSVAVCKITFVSVDDYYMFHKNDQMGIGMTVVDSGKWDSGSVSKEYILSNKNNTKTISTKDIPGMTGKKVLIYSGIPDLEVEGKLLYASEGVTLNSNKNAILKDKDNSSIEVILFQQVD